MRLAILAIAWLLFICNASAGDSNRARSILYISANADSISFRAPLDGKPGTDICTGDSCLGEARCDIGPDYVCVDINNNSLFFVVPRDLRRRIPETLEKDTDKKKSLKWSALGFEYEVWGPTSGHLRYGQPIWGPVGFVGHDVLAIRVAVYKPGKVDFNKPEAVFLYSPEQGVLAFDHPFGSKSGEIVFRSYWLEGRCGLIPIEPCHERPTR